MRLLLIMCCLFTGYPLLWAQSMQVRFYDHSEGLESKWTGKIDVDDKGEIWMINNDDLIRYNGYEKKVLQLTEDNSSPVYVNDFVLDQKSIWIATQEHLIHYDRITLKKKTIDIGGFTALHLDSDRNLWATCEKGLVQVDQSYQVTFLQDSTDWGSLAIFDLQHDGQGSLWISTVNKGLMTYDIENSSFQEISGLTNAKGDPQLKMRDLLLDKNGSIWAGSSGGGLFHLKNDKIRQFLPSKTPGAISSTEAYTLEQDASGNIWIGTWAGGLNYFDVASEKFTSYRSGDKRSNGLPSNVIVDLHIREGQMWIGTAYSGLWMTDLSDQVFTWWNKETSPIPLVSDNFWAIHEDKEKHLWLGTYQGGLYKISPDQQYTHYQPFKDLPSNTVWGFFENEIGVWVASNRGLLLKKSGIETLSLFSSTSNTPTGWENNNVFIIEGNDDLLYLGIWDAGVFEYDISQNSVKKILEGTNLSDLELTQDGTLWIASNAQLFTYDPSEDVIAQPFEGPDLAPRPSIFLEAHDGLWLSNKEGLFQMKEGQFEKLEHELLYKVFNPIEAKDSTIWISSTYGLVTLSRDRTEISLVPEQNRTISNSPNARAVARTSEGRLFFGGLTGIVSFDPQQVKLYGALPETRIDAFNIGNRQISIHEGRSPEHSSDFNLSHKDLVFSFDYSTINYAHPDEINYAYQLDGLSDEWIFTTAQNRKASFAGLAPGQYQFHVKARTPGGIWGPTTSLNIYMAPPWWKTNFAFVFYFLGTCLLVISVHRIRMESLRRNEKRLKTEIARQTQRLQENNQELAVKNKELQSLSKFKEGLTHMIVHDMKNPLNAVIGLTEGKPTGDKMSQIRQSGQTILQMITNMLDIQKFEEVNIKIDPEATHLHTLVTEAGREVQLLLETRGIVFQNEVSTDILVFIDKSIILRVFINLLTNAIKYSTSGTQITIKAKVEECRVAVEVVDQGMGISNEALPYIFEKFWQYEARKSGKISSNGLGLTYSKLAIESHQGHISVASEPGQGSTFKFDLPFHGLSEKTVVIEQQRQHSHYTEPARSQIQAMATMIKDIPLYNVSQIMKILNQNEENDPSSEVEKWKSSVLDATYHNDKDRFEALISI